MRLEMNQISDNYLDEKTSSETKLPTSKGTESLCRVEVDLKNPHEKKKRRKTYHFVRKLKF